MHCLLVTNPSPTANPSSSKCLPTQRGSSCIAPVYGFPLSAFQQPASGLSSSCPSGFQISCFRSLNPDL